MEMRSIRPFPAGTIVSTPAATHVPGDCLVFPRLSSSEQVSETREWHGARIAGWEVEEEAAASTELWDRLDALPVRVRIRDWSQLEDPALLERLRQRKPFCVLRPGPDLFRAVNLLTSVGIPVRVDTSTPVEDPDVLLSALDHYLHSPTLATPVEPFHGLLLALSASSDRSLWELESEDVEIHFHVTADGKVTLSRRWAEAGHYYGTAHDPWDNLIQSDAYARFAAFPVDLLGAAGPCATCAHFDLCKGFLRAVDPEQPCDPWQAAFDKLKEAVSLARSQLDGDNRSEAGAAP